MDETPVDPYINVSEYYEGVRIKIVESGIAVEHPTDSARLRLHDFREWGTRYFGVQLTKPRQNIRRWL